jgi:hypothetical protein
MELRQAEACRNGTRYRRIRDHFTPHGAHGLQPVGLSAGWMIVFFQMPSVRQKSRGFARKGRR